MTHQIWVEFLDLSKREWDQNDLESKWLQWPSLAWILMTINSFYFFQHRDLIKTSSDWETRSTWHLKDLPTGIKENSVQQRLFSIDCSFGNTRPCFIFSFPLCLLSALLCGSNICKYVSWIKMNSYSQEVHYKQKGNHSLVTMWSVRSCMGLFCFL